MFRLKERYGRTALVTGASSGIGQAFARTLAAEGMDVVVVARRAERLEALKAELEAKHGVRVYPIVQDLAAAAACGAIAQRLKEEAIDVDLLVNNAGFGQWGDFSSYDLQTDLDMVSVNCRAVVELTHRLLPGMKGRRCGAVVVVSSVLGRIPAPWLAVYSATKAFDKYFAESLYTECRPFGVDVISIEPGLTETEFRAGSGQKSPPVKPRTSEQVVATTLRALGRKPSVADGFFNRAYLNIAEMLPRKWVLAVYTMVRKPRK